MKKRMFLGLFFGLLTVFVVGSSAQNPAFPGKFCSKDTDYREVKVRVFNKTQSTIHLNWVSYESTPTRTETYSCVENTAQPTVEISPGDSFELNGTNGTAYRVREKGTNKVLREFYMVPGMPQINLTGVAAAAPPPSNLPPPKDEVIYVFKNKANVTNCTPSPGWAKCIQLAEPTIRIMATKAVSQSAMNGVANVYSEMMRRLSSKYPKNKLDTFIVHMTNAEPWSELINLAPIGMAYPQTPYESSGDWLRGYGNPDNLWITEQMICKQGVATRNARKPNSDNTNRLFDQVVHEFGHSLHSNLLTDQIVNSTFKFPNGTQWLTPLESFPYRIQQWFRTPNIDHVAVSPKEESFLKGFFTARATFSCDGYKP
jgi:hypothetical protein